MDKFWKFKYYINDNACKLSKNAMKTLGLEYRDRDPRSTKKSFVERLAAQAITRVRRRLLPQLRLKTPQEEDENGKKKRRRGNAKTVEYDEVIHVKTVPAPSKTNQRSEIDVKEKSYTSMETVLVTNESSTCSPMTDSIGGSILPNLREMFSAYFEGGGKLDNWSSMEEMVREYEYMNKKKKKVTADIFEIDCDDLITKKNDEGALFDEVESGLGVIKGNHDEKPKDYTSERLNSVEEKDGLLTVEKVNREIKNRKGTKNGKTGETKKGKASVENNNKAARNSREKVDKKKSTLKKGDFKYCGECNDVSTLKIESETKIRWLKEMYGELVCVGDECGRVMSEVVKTDNYAWVCKNCRGNDRTCDRMMCNGCWEKERGGRRGRGINRTRG